MRLLLAFDKFKHSMSAPEACRAARNGVMTAQPEWEVQEAPLTDGGDGFAEVLVEAAGGQLHSERVSGPGGNRIDAAYGVVESQNIPEDARRRLGVSGSGRIVVIEMAQCSGLSRLPESRWDPRRTVTSGVGELMRTAIRHAPECLLLGVGGSATHDLGLGALVELGLRFSESAPPPCPANWPEIGELTAFEPPALPPIRIACDVTSPLLGDRGAAAVFSKQKGLPAEAIPRLEEQTQEMAGRLLRFFGKSRELLGRPGSGAAGGIAFGLMVALDARAVPGFQLAAEWLQLRERLEWAEAVWTGEGSFDDSSLDGKGPGRVLGKALEMGRQCAVLAGVIELSENKRDELRGTPLLALADEGPGGKAAFHEGPERLRKLAAKLVASPDFRDR